MGMAGHTARRLLLETSHARGRGGGASGGGNNGIGSNQGLWRGQRGAYPRGDRGTEGETSPTAWRRIARASDRSARDQAGGSGVQIPAKGGTISHDPGSFYKDRGVKKSVIML